MFLIESFMLMRLTKNGLQIFQNLLQRYYGDYIKDKYSYLEIELITGKTHQIRAHLSAYGHPIVGDSKYANKQQKTVKIDFAKMEAVSPISEGAYPKYQLLHAYRIVFPTLDGDLAYLSDKEFLCEEPYAFAQFRQNYFR